MARQAASGLPALAVSDILQRIAGMAILRQECQGQGSQPQLSRPLRINFLGVCSGLKLKFIRLHGANIKPMAHVQLDALMFALKT